jgi:hypothetical protein
MKYIVKIAILFILMSIFPAKADNFTREDLSDPVFKEANYYYRIGIDNKAIDLYEKIARDYHGTDIGANAQLFLAEIYLTDEPYRREKGLQEFRDVINTYPETRYWLVARSSLIDYLYDPVRNYDDWMRKQNELILETGGISLFDLMNDNYENFDSSTIASKYRDDLANIYYSIAISQKEVPSSMDGNKFKILRFLREKFPKFVWSDPIREIQCAIFLKIDFSFRKKIPLDNTPPIIRPIAPHDGLEIGEAIPKIEVEVEDGDVFQMQVDLSKTVFTLDGKDLTDEMNVKSEINTDMKWCRTLDSSRGSRCGSGAYIKGPTFEKLRLTYYLPCDHPDHHSGGDGSCGCCRNESGGNQGRSSYDAWSRPKGHFCDNDKGYPPHSTCSHCGHRHCTTSLSPGWHTVYVKAFDYSNHTFEKTWRFYVKK